MKKLRLFKKWLDSTKAATYEGLINLVVLEEVKSKMPMNILKHVEERGATRLERAAEMADAYSLLVRSLGRVVSQVRPVRPSSDSYFVNGSEKP